MDTKEETLISRLIPRLQANARASFKSREHSFVTVIVKI
jgi:hypothetical protein